ncbi:MAG TPA: signal peptidase II [Verrucomicrobiales bacterium]|nr:signal peptidase II [Verrucomicrobiales bacterium]
MSFLRSFLLITLPLFVLDQVTKASIVRTFREGDHFPVVAGFFDIVRVHNTGVAWGHFNGSSYSNLIFGIVALAAIAFVLWLWKRQAFPNTPSRIAVFLLLAGVFGNLTDRIFRGYVVDFLLFYVNEWQWPAFNVADSCICISAGLLIVAAFLPEQKADRAPAPAPD